MKVGILATVVIASVLTTAAQAESPKSHADQPSVEAGLIGAWHLVQMLSPSPDGKASVGPAPEGMLIYTADGHMSVQLMYPPSAHTPANEYVAGGYEASFGTYVVDTTSHRLTHHIQGSVTRGLLVGKNLPRVYQLSPDGHLIITSADPAEHWSVTWEHY